MGAITHNRHQLRTFDLVNPLFLLYLHILFNMSQEVSSWATAHGWRVQCGWVWPASYLNPVQNPVWGHYSCTMLALFEVLFTLAPYIHQRFVLYLWLCTKPWGIPSWNSITGRFRSGASPACPLCFRGTWCTLAISWGFPVALLQLQ
jgi:hypothetical protein